MSMSTLSRQQLREAAARYLQDAYNKECCLHTRYSAACTAMITSHLAGLASDAEVAFALSWEARRYEPGAEPDELDLDLIVASLECMLA